VERHSAAVELLRQWIPRKTLPTTRGTLSLFLYDLAYALRDTGDLAGAVRTLQESAQIRRQIMEADPNNISFRRRLFSLNYVLAEVHGHPFYLNLGDAAAAERYATDAMREAERMAKEDHGSDRSVRDRMFGNWVLGCVLLPNASRRALPYLEAAVASAQAQTKSEEIDVLHDEALAQAQEALGLAFLATGNRQRAMELLRESVTTFERISAEAPRIIDYRVGLIRAANSYGDAMPVNEAAKWYRKAFEAAAAFPAAPAAPRNVREQLSRAEVHLRWPRWNPTASLTERREKLEIALESWRQLAASAPGNRSVRASLDEAQRLLAQAQ
jgi:tetratricopeptide (TPR) repeat protein